MRSYRVYMASPSAGSSREAGAPPPVAGGAPSNAAPSNGAPVDTTELDTLCEKAITADKNTRPALAAGLYRRAADEALRLHEDTFVSTFLTLQRALSLCCQAHLEGVTMRRWWKAKPAACQPTLMAGRRAHLAFQKYSKEAFIHYNAPPLHLADKLISEALDIHFKGEKWHFSHAGRQRGLFSTESRLLHRLKQEKPKLPCMVG